MNLKRIGNFSEQLPLFHGRWLATSPGDWPLVLRTDPMSMWLTADPHDCPIAQRAGHLVGGIPHDLTRLLVQVAGLQARRLAIFLPG